MPTETEIQTQEQLRERYAPAIERARIKVLRRLDEHCRSFIELSPFLCLGSSHGGDVSPRGDEPGFVRLLDETRLAIPDWPGNNRLDSFENILANPSVGLLFLIPGVNETLRVNGVARLTLDEQVLGLWAGGGKRPRAALVVEVREAYLHCGKALIRSRLWTDEYRIDRGALPSYGAMLKDQIEIAATAGEIQASVEEGYAKNLY
jgi:uncharacterized protein